MADTRRLVLSAQEIKQITGWPDAMVEDYLNILEDFVALSDEIGTDTARIDALEVALAALTLVVSNFITAQTATNAAVQLDLKKLEQLAYA